MSDLVYVVHDLVKQYPGQEQPANKHINLAIEQGKIFGILGSNGAGKTTLVRQMVNLQRSTSGQITLYGRDIRQHPYLIPQYVGYMPQDSEALNNMSVSEALYFTAHLRGMSRSDARRERDALLKLWQIEELRAKYSPRLSGGQKRILRLAVATAARPPILILDEPTNDLDPQKRKLVWDVLRHLNSEYGTTIIFITHDAIEAEKIVQRVGIMRQGSFVAMGLLADLKREVGEKMRLELFFPADSPPPLPAHLQYSELAPGRWLVLLERHEAGAVLDALPMHTIDDFHLYSATLEDIYLHYVTKHPATTNAAH